VRDAVLLCAAQRANELVRQKIHPTSIIAGFRLARKECVKYIKVSRECGCCRTNTQR
jgi:chaperonin GroEL (HSP60 family)